MINNVGLILEGGGMRGVYTAGVLDFFMDADIWLSHCYGVSAGAVNATNYLSKQRGGTFRITANYINDKRYCSIHNLISTGDMFGVDFLYNRIPNELDPFDYKAFKKSDISMRAIKNSRKVRLHCLVVCYTRNILKRWRLVSDGISCITVSLNW